MLRSAVTVHTQVWIRSAIVRIWLNFYVCCRVRRPRGAEPMILHTYRDVQEAVPYSPSYGVNCNVALVTVHAILDQVCDCAYLAKFLCLL